MIQHLSVRSRVHCFLTWRGEYVCHLESTPNDELLQLGAFLLIALKVKSPIKNQGFSPTSIDFLRPSDQGMVITSNLCHDH